MLALVRVLNFSSLLHLTFTALLGGLARFLVSTILEELISCLGYWILRCSIDFGLGIFIWVLKFCFLSRDIDLCVGILTCVLDYLFESWNTFCIFRYWFVSGNINLCFGLLIWMLKYFFVFSDINLCLGILICVAELFIWILKFYFRIFKYWFVYWRLPKIMVQVMILGP